MGSVKKRTDGMWRARYRDPEGREHAKHFARKVDAERFLSVIEADKLRGTYLDPRAGMTTFREHADRWLASQSLRESSRRTYDSYLRNRILPVFGDRYLASVTPTEVRGFVKVQGETAAPNTVRAVHVLLSAVFTSAVEDGLIPKSPCIKTAPRKPHREPVAPLTVAQVEALLAEVPERYRAIVAVGAGCGLRLGETLGLKVSCVRFLARELDVEEQLTLLPGSPPQLRPLKTRSSRRTVPTPRLVVDALAEHLAAHPTATTDLVFRSRTGGPVWPNSFGDSVWRPAVKRINERAAEARKRGEPDLVELPAGVRFHDLRHFLASLLIASGESVKTVQAVLGHASAVETLQTYSHLWPDSDQRARAAVDDAFNTGAETTALVAAPLARGEPV